MAIGSKNFRVMRTRLFSLILALFAVLLPSAAWADDQGYVKLEVNNGAASIGADDATLSLTFLYGEKPTNVDGEIDDATVWYFDLNAGEQQVPAWINGEELISDVPRDISKKYASKVTSATITPAFNTNVKPISCAYWFIGCDKITAIDGIEDLNTSESLSFFAMFYGTRKISDFDMRKWETGNVKFMAHMFDFGVGHQSIDVSHFDTHNVMDFRWMFGSCYNVKELNTSSFSISQGANLQGMFAFCYMIEELDLSNINPIHIGNARDMFNNDLRLSTIYVSQDWSSYLQNASNMFYNCFSLPEWDANKTSGTYATTAEGGYFTLKSSAWVYDGSNKTLYLNSRTENIDPDNFTPEATGSESISNCKMSYFGGSNWDLNNSLAIAQIDKSEILRVVIEPSFFIMRPTTCESWFSGMSNATFEGLENLNTTECTSMKDMFKGCANVENLDFSTADLKLTFKTSKVTDMSGMFADMTNLTSVTLASNFSTANVTTMKDMFSGCSSLTDIGTLSEYINTIKVTDMSGMFRGCSSLVGNVEDTETHVKTLNLSTFYTGGVTDMTDMFNGCSAVKLLNISSFSTPKVTKMAGMFKGCSVLKTITVDLSFTADNVTDNGEDMFLGCLAIVGGDNTKYDAGEVDASYAHIDESTDPGYLTEIAPVECIFYGDSEHDNSGTLAGYDGKTGIVHIRRTFEAGKWTTLCLPIDMNAKQIATVFGAGTVLKTLSAATRSGEKVGSVTFADATEIEAGKPYLIKPTKAPVYFDNGRNYDGFRLSHKQVTATPVSVSKNGFSMRGTFNPAELNVSADTYTLKENQTEASPALSSLAAVSKEAILPALQVQFVDMKVGDYTLTVSDAGTATLYLPFAVEIPDAHYFVATIVREVVADLDPDNGYTATAILQQVKKGVIPAYTGVVINANPGTYQMCVTDEETGEDLSKNLLHGVLEDTPIAELEYEDGSNKAQRIAEADYEDYAIFFAMKGKEKNIGFFYNTAYDYKTEQNDVTTYPDKFALANKAYLRISEETAQAMGNIRYIGTSFGGDGETTGIEDVEDNTVKTSGIYYNLNGQRVAAPTKGIYIKDGKKVYVK